jgi:hypothetical protein
LVRASASSLGSNKRKPASIVDPPATIASLRETCVSADTGTHEISLVLTCNEMSVKQRGGGCWYTMDSKHFINALLLHKALKHDLHLSILSTHDCSDIACWWWFACFGGLPVWCIKRIMPSLLTCDRIMYKSWHLRPLTVAIWSCILWTKKLAGHGPKPDPKSRRFKQIETQYIIPEELQQRVQGWRSRKQGNEVEMEQQ